MIWGSCIFPRMHLFHFFPPSLRIIMGATFGEKVQHLHRNYKTAFFSLSFIIRASHLGWRFRHDIMFSASHGA